MKKIVKISMLTGLTLMGASIVMGSMGQLVAKQKEMIAQRITSSVPVSGADHYR